MKNTEEVAKLEMTAKATVTKIYCWSEGWSRRCCRREEVHHQMSVLQEEEEAEAFGPSCPPGAAIEETAQEALKMPFCFPPFGLCLSIRLAFIKLKRAIKCKKMPKN
jgi:hypothetical protein